MTEDKLHEVLGIVAAKLGQQMSLHDVCLIGTAATLVHGVAVPVGDVDFLMKDREGVDVFGRALEGFPCLSPPSLLEGEVQYFAAYEVEGVKVEASTVEVETASEFMEAVGSGPWTYHSLFRFGGFDLPVVALELRLATELRRDRPDRFEPIVGHFREHGETPLLREVLAALDLETKYQQAQREV